MGVFPVLRGEEPANQFSMKVAAWGGQSQFVFPARPGAPVVTFDFLQ